MSDGQPVSKPVDNVNNWGREILADTQADVARDEGFSAKVYKDTEGHDTIGHGFNLEDGMTEDESLVLLRYKLQKCGEDLHTRLPWFAGLPAPAQRGLLNMRFNLGWPRLSGFKLMLGALEEGRWDDAAQQAMASHWAVQVGQRAVRIAALYRSCGAASADPASLQS